MQFQLKSNRDVWVYCAAITITSIAIAELSLTLAYLTIGDLAFSKHYVILMSAVIPIMVAAPVSYFIARITLRLGQAHTRLRHLADTDELTGLTNRRCFFQRAANELAEATANKLPMSLLVIDADFFKQLNDTYGHATGDAALQFITDRLLRSVRKHDLVCRLGGEEFAILLPEMIESQALKLAQRILSDISSQPMFHDSKIIEMSVSCGVADTSISYEMTALFKAADDALYAAKDSGRNRCVLFSSIMIPKSGSRTAVLRPE